LPRDAARYTWGVDPYRILGLPAGATLQEVQRAYRQLARRWHPDVNPDPQARSRFAEATAAYETLRERGKSRGERVPVAVVVRAQPSRCGRDRTAPERPRWLGVGEGFGRPRWLDARSGLERPRWLDVEEGLARSRWLDARSGLERPRWLDARPIPGALRWRDPTPWRGLW